MLFNSMTADGKKKNSNKTKFTTEVGILLLVLYIFGNSRKYFEKTLRRLTFKNFDKVAEVFIPSFFTEGF